MRIYGMILGILCVWRLTHLLYAEDGPWDILFRLRQLTGQSALARLLDCFYCLSLWIACPIAYAIARDFAETLLLWPALSAGAILLERMSRPRTEMLNAAYMEDQEEDHGMLRPTENSIQNRDSRL